MCISIDGNETNRITVLQCDAENRLRQIGRPIVIRSSKYMNNMIEQDRRRITRPTRFVLGFKSETAAGITLAGIERVHRMCKQKGIASAQMHSLPNNTPKHSLHNCAQREPILRSTHIFATQSSRVDVSSLYMFGQYRDYINLNGNIRESFSGGFLENR